MLEVVCGDDGSWAVVYDWRDVDVDGPHWVELGIEAVSEYVGRMQPDDLFPLCWTMMPDWRELPEPEPELVDWAEISPVAAERFGKED